MKVKHSIMIGLMGRQADRFHEYSPTRSFTERIEMCKQVKGVQGIEVIYPSDFGKPNETEKLIRDSGFEVSAVNLNVKSDTKWRRGSFSAQDPKVREAAVGDMKICMDLANVLGSNMVTCCPLADGHDYNFQIDYTERWHYLLEGIREAARYRSDVKIALEYKPNEIRNYIVLPNVGTTLYLCSQIGLPNVGVTVDSGHALVANETPAQSICLAADAGRLFYVHLNDNTRNFDWDMIPATVNLWDFLEILLYLDKFSWSNWFSYDVMTRQGDLVKQIQSTINIIDRLQCLLEKLGKEKLQSLIDEGIPANTYEYLIRSLL